MPRTKSPMKKVSVKPRQQRGWLTKAEAKKAVMQIEVEGKPIAKVMREMNYAASTATDQPQSLTENPLYVQAKNALQASILKHNASIFDKTAKVVDAGLSANITKFFAHEGRVIQTRKVADLPTRLKYAEIVADLFGFRGVKDAAVAPINVAMLIQIIREAEQTRGLA